MFFKNQKVSRDFVGQNLFEIGHKKVFIATTTKNDDFHFKSNFDLKFYFLILKDTFYFQL